MNILNHQKIRILLLSGIILLIINCKEKQNEFKTKFTEILTSDSIGYWNCNYQEFEYGVKGGPIKTYGFRKDGTLEYYDMSFYKGIPSNRHFIRLDTAKTRWNSRLNRWRISDDSILNLFGAHDYKVIYYTKDTVLLRQLTYFNNPVDSSIDWHQIFYRMRNNNLMLDEESQKHKDSADLLYKK